MKCKDFFLEYIPFWLAQIVQVKQVQHLTFRFFSLNKLKMCKSWKESFRESGNITAALIHLEENEEDIFDKIQLLEMKGTYNLILEKFSVAEKIYEELLRRNVECGQYYEHLIISKQLSEECFIWIQHCSQIPSSFNNYYIIN